LLIRYTIDEIRYQYNNNKKYYYSISLLCGSHSYEFKIMTMQKKYMNADVVSKVIIPFRNADVYSMVQRNFTKFGISFKRYNVKWEYSFQKER